MTENKREFVEVVNRDTDKALLRIDSGFMVIQKSGKIWDPICGGTNLPMLTMKYAGL